MCDKCKELDEKISRYRRFTAYPLDDLTAERIKGLTADLDRQKRALRCDEPTAE